MNEIKDITEKVDDVADEQAPVNGEAAESCENTDNCEPANDAVEETSPEGPQPSTKGSDAEVILALREELGKLKSELENSRAAYGRLSAECADFSELYPDVSVTSLPDSVWKSFKSGVPLAAAYALYEKRESMAAAKAADVNAKNKELSSGSLDSSKSEEFFSPAEVRAMSAAEVRANYAKIITSMSKWH